MHPTDDIFERVRKGEVDAVRSRLAADPTLASRRHPSGLSLLMFACYQQQPALAREIRRSLAAIDLFEASALPGGEREGAALLDADPSQALASSADGFTPLHLAAFFGNAPMAARLLEAGADANALARNGSRLRPIHSAAAGRCLEISRLLLDAGADPNARQQGGFTPLHAAAEHGDRPLIDLLLDHGASLAERADDGQTAADLARERGHAELADQLSATARRD
jgi:ankyrin repeat protein